MWELDYKESWAPKNWCIRTVVPEKALESPLGSKDIQPVNPKGNQSWIFIGRTDAEGEVSILWPPDAKSQLIGKDPDGEKDWGQEEKEKGATEDEMVGWHHWLSGQEFEQTLGDSEGQGCLMCCSPGDHKESDTTEQLNWTEAIVVVQSPGYVQLFVTPQTAALHVTLSLTISQSLTKFSSLHWWCRLAVSSSDALFSFCPGSFPAPGTSSMNCLCTTDDQNTGVSASSSVLPVNIQGWSPLRLTSLISLLSRGLSGVFSSTTVRRHQFFGILPYL